jgi:hypothetical protein
MKGATCFLLIALMLGGFAACSGKRDEVSVEKSQMVFPVKQNVKIRVVDVSNDTGKIFDVDVIGMLWNGLDQSLRKRGLLWTEDSSVVPLRLEAHILKYSKGNVFARNLVPLWGKTELAVRCDLKEGDREVATIENKETISIGHEGLTVGAWRKIFTVVSEKVVNQLANKI